MKKVLSVALLVVFLFNVGGYYLVFWALRAHTDRQINYRLDSNQYHEDETIEIKIRVAFPYPLQAQDFQRVDGRFEHGGEFFRLVKQKLQNDTLYIVCIRDHQTRQLVNTMHNYIELTQAVPLTGQKTWNLVSKLIKDFYSGPGLSLLQQGGFCMDIPFAISITSFLPPIIPVHGPPPRV